MRLPDTIKPVLVAPGPVAASAKLRLAKPVPVELMQPQRRSSPAAPTLPLLSTLSARFIEDVEASQCRDKRLPAAIRASAPLIRSDSQAATSGLTAPGSAGTATTPETFESPRGVDCRRRPCHPEHQGPRPGSMRQAEAPAPQRRAHWKLSDHCSTLLLPAVNAPPKLPTFLGRFLWLQHQADRKPSKAEVKEVSRCFQGMLSGRARRRTLDAVQLPEGLLQLRWLDSWTRRLVIRKLESFMRSRRVSAVSLENAMMASHEGAQVLRALVSHSTACLTELHLCCAFQVGNGPLLHDGKGSEFIRVLSLLHCLKVLAINYAYLADNTGTALLGLQAVRNGTLEELQLLCLLQETPHRQAPRVVGVARSGVERNGCIPREAWEGLRAVCPGLAVSVVLMAVGRYEDVNAFLSPPMTVRSLVLSTGVDLCGGKAPCRLPMRLPLTLRTVVDWYSVSLEEINLNLWRGVDPVDSELVRLVQCLPKLRIFDFRGPVSRLDFVERLLEEILNNQQNLSYIRLTLQESLTVPPNVNFRQEVTSLECRYLQLFEEKKIHLRLRVAQL